MGQGGGPYYVDHKPDGFGHPRGGLGAPHTTRRMKKNTRGEGQEEEEEEEAIEEAEEVMF